MSTTSRVRKITPRPGAPESEPEKPVKRQIVVKRVYKHAAAGQSGVWKIAFADFAMAMMAFFLTMWLMGATTADERGGISQYFRNPTMVDGKSPSPDESVVQADGGASKTAVDFGSEFELFPEHEKQESSESEGAAKFKKEDRIIMVIDGDADRERQRLQSLKDDLKEAIQSKPTLRQYAEHILMDLTGEGLRIQMIDKENRSMFPLGSAALEPFGASVLEQLATLIGKVSNHISISGHTDSRQYQRPGYSNWELSIDRANAARRALLAGGLSEEKIGRVVGLSTSAPLDRGDLQNPINRRISIIVLNKRTEQAIVQESGAVLGVQTEQEQTGMGM